MYLKSLILSILSYFIFITLSYGQIYNLDRPFKSHLEMHQLRGKVKEIKEYHYKGIKEDQKNLMIDTALEMYFITTYNEYGNKLSYKQFRSNHSMADIELYSYDNKNRLITKRDGDNEKKITGTGILTYDNRGLINTEINIFVPNKHVMVEKHFYHDRQNRLIKTTSLFPSDKSIIETDISYEANKEVVKSVGKIEKKISTTTRTYDGKTKLMLTEQNSYNYAKETRVDFKYDKYGNTVLKKSFKEEEEDFSTQEAYKYIYDDSGNWVTRIASFGSPGGYQTNVLTKRIISYYP